MDEHLDELRRLRAELVARSERLRLWSRLARARMDLLTAQVCPPATADEVADDDLAELAVLVLGTGPAVAPTGEDGVEALLALREARRVLARRREHLDDLVCWSTAQLLLEASAHAPLRTPLQVLGRSPQDDRAGVPAQRPARRSSSRAPRGRDPRGGAVVALVPPPAVAGPPVPSPGGAGEPAIGALGALGAATPTGADAACHTPR